MVLPLETLRAEMARNCRSFRFLLKIKTLVLQNYWLNFVHQGINRHFSTRKKLLDRQTMHWFPCNGNLMGKTSQKLKIGLIRLQIKTPFPSKQQLSRLLPSESWSVIHSMVYKMIHYPYFFFNLPLINWMALIVKSFVWWFLSLELFFFTATACMSSSRCQSKSLGFEQFWNGEIYVLLLAAEMWLTENPKICTCMWLFSRFQLIYLQNYQLDFFHQDLSGQFFFCV